MKRFKENAAMMATLTVVFCAAYFFGGLERAIFIALYALAKRES